MAATERSRSAWRSLTNSGVSLPSYTGFVYALVLVWGLGDIVSTYVAVAAVGDVTMEANPWIRILLNTEPLLVLVLKAAVVLYAGVVLLECRSVVQRVPGWQVWFGAVVVVGWLVVVNNLAIGIAAMA